MFLFPQTIATHYGGTTFLVQIHHKTRPRILSSTKAVPFLIVGLPLVAVGGYGDVEMPWWTYGWRGMALWFPSSLAKPLSPSTRESMVCRLPSSLVRMAWITSFILCQAYYAAHPNNINAVPPCAHSCVHALDDFPSF